MEEYPSKSMLIVPAGFQDMEMREKGNTSEGSVETPPKF
jgi:hypothetical protein